MNPCDPTAHVRVPVHAGRARHFNGRSPRGGVRGDGDVAFSVFHVAGASFAVSVCFGDQRALHTASERGRQSARRHRQKQAPW